MIGSTECVLDSIVNGEEGIGIGGRQRKALPVFGVGEKLIQAVIQFDPGEGVASHAWSISSSAAAIPCFVGIS